MRTITAAQIKREGISAVDELVAQGAVQVIYRSVPRYVILTIDAYEELREGYDANFLAEARASHAAIARGEGHTARTVAEHLAFIDAADDE